MVIVSKRWPHVPRSARSSGKNCQNRDVTSDNKLCPDRSIGLLGRAYPNIRVPILVIGDRWNEDVATSSVAGRRSPAVRQVKSVFVLRGDRESDTGGGLA